MIVNLRKLVREGNRLKEIKRILILISILKDHWLPKMS